MSFKETLQKLGEKSRRRKEMIRQLDEQMRVEKLVEERTKSANLRELERYEKEDFESAVKKKLDYMRKKRDDDIKFGHNPLNTKNIMKSDWEVMKEKTIFKGNKNIFTNQPFIHKSDKNILRNNRKLYSI
jgi:hypothetical protein